MSGLPLQVEQADQRAENLMKGKTDDKAPQNDQDQDQPKTVEELERQLKDTQSRLSVLQGKYNKEVKGADSQQLQRLENENANLRRDLRQMQEAMTANENLVKEIRTELDKAKSEPKPEAPVDVKTILTEDEIAHLESEDLGGKVLDIFMKLAKTAGSSELSNQLKAISSKVDNVNARVEKAEQKQADTTLLSVIPDFYKVNSDERWGPWLDDTMRRQSLQEALSSGDFETVKKGVDLFKAEVGYDSPEKPTKEPKQKTPPIEPDESFSSDETKVGKRTYTQAQVKKFYEDVTKGRWDKREQEAAAIDKDITLAMNEGRITP